VLQGESVNLECDWRLARLGGRCFGNS